VCGILNLWKQILQIVENQLTINIHYLHTTNQANTLTVIRKIIFDSKAKTRAKLITCNNLLSL